MSPRRAKKTYLTNELLTDDEFLTIKDVFEHQWLLEHTHDFPEMIYVLSGKGTQYIDGTAIAANEGELYIIPIGTSHVFRPSTNIGTAASLQVRDLIFRAEWLEDLSHIVVDPQAKELTYWLFGKSSPSELKKPAWLKINDTQSEFRILTERMKSLIQMKPPQSPTRLASSVLELLSLICLATNGGKHHHSEWPIKQDMHPIRAQILNTIETMPLPMISLKEVARRFQRSERHLSRLFQDHFKMSFNRYIQEYRLQEGMKLLQDTSLTVKEIMKKIGYSDTDHFNGLFKSKTGMTPRQYRSRVIQQQLI